MGKNTLEIIKKLSDEGLIKEISISVFKNNQKIKDFNKFDSNKNFHIFSAGKPFIAAVIWKLHDKKLLNFDDPVIKIPPKISFKKVKEERFPSANRKPKKADITTRLDSLSFKRAIKPLNFKENDNLETVSKYYIFSEITTIYYL